MPQDESPPASPPSPNATESELKLSKKREREASLEPVTTPKASVETDPLLRETRTPAKKNRRQLAPTDEEEDGTTHSRSNSSSPPISASPPQEMKIKVRQISQGVEDLSWRNMRAPVSEDMESEPAEHIAPPPIENQQPVQSASQQAEEPTPIKADDETPPKSPADSQLSQSVSELPPSASTSVDNLTSDDPSRLRADSECGDKGLKRKFVERGTSQGPQENGDASNHASEPLKRPRDDPDKDDNPREAKRPSPPPEPKSPKKTSPPSPKVPKLSGFSAYASSSSPFASVKGQNVFSKSSSPPSFSGTPSPSPFSPNAIPSPPTSVVRSTFGNKAGESSSTSTPTATKRTGFEAFASTASPFASVTRSKSPVLGSASKLNRNKSPPRRGGSASSNPFASYAGELQSFAAPMSKRPRAGSPDGSSRSSVERGTSKTLGGGSGADSGAEEEEERHTSFGEKLRSTKDDDEDRSDEEQQKVKLTEQEVLTGEEDEETLTQVRGKLFTIMNGGWKERGTGLLKLNVKRIDGSGARLVMRKEAVYTLLLNVTLFPGMKCNINPQDPRYLRFSIIEDGNTTHYNLRVSNAKIAQDLLEEINANIPMA
ncbi:hypothetical protein BDQ17DRAFT_1283715 [Cyathus striatus]|nr:hypothetical protein BDQ17DRAFT_1283715 [Cyathus striatus]